VTHHANTGRAHLDRPIPWALLALLAGCAADPAPVASEWPPADFRLVVEELQESVGDVQVRRRFAVGADGVCVYGRASSQVVDPQTATSLPVFSSLCAYRLLADNTRLLARKLHRRGVLKLESVQGDQRATGGVSMRLFYRAFGCVKTVTSSGQIHGAMAQILTIVNAYLPTGELFRVAGMSGDPEPSTLRGVPDPVDDAVGALGCYRELLQERPDDEELLLGAFALACRTGDRGIAFDLLQRWNVAHQPLPAVAPQLDAPRLTPDILMRLLPPPSGPDPGGR